MTDEAEIPVRDVLGLISCAFCSNYYLRPLAVFRWTVLYAEHKSDE